MKNRNKKTIMFFIISTVVILISVTAGLTAAYFQGNFTGDPNAGVSVETAEAPTLDFEIGDDLNIYADMYNFYDNAGDISDFTTATATLTTLAAVTTGYYVDFNITLNEFIYTTENNETEILLVIEDPSGEIVTSATGLEFVTISDELKGFDVTESIGNFVVASNYSISTDGVTESTVQEWKVYLYFINLDTAQNYNANKSFVGNLSIGAF